MGNNIVKLSVLLSANAAQASTEMTKFSSDAKKAAAESKAALDSITSNAGQSLTGLIGKGASFGLGMLGIHSFMESMKHGFEIAEQNEKAAVSFRVLLGSAEAAKETLKDLKKFSGESGMRFGDARAGASSLLKFGFNKDDIQGMLKVIGDFSTISMDGQAESMQRIIQLFGVIKDQGSLTSRNMKALAAEGVEPWKALGETLGVTRQELKRLLEAGEIDSATGLFAVQSAMRDKSFGGMLDDAQRLSRQMEDLKKNTDGIFADFAGMAVESLGLAEAVKFVADEMKVARANAKGFWGGLSDKWQGIKMATADLFFDKEVGDNMMVRYNSAKAWTAELKKAKEAGADLSSVMAIMKQHGVTDENNFLDLGLDKQKEAWDTLRNINVELEILNAWEEADLKIHEQVTAQLKLQEQKRQLGIEQMEDYIAQLQVANDTFGMSDHDKKMAKAKKLGVDDGVLERADVAFHQNEALKEHAKLVAEGAKVMESVKSPTRHYADEMVNLSKLLLVGAINWDAFRLSAQKAHNELHKGVGEAYKDLIDQMNEARFSKDDMLMQKAIDAGADDGDIMILQELMRQRDEQKKINDLKKEAERLNESELTGLSKAREEVRRIVELQANGLNDEAAAGMLAKVKKDLADHQKKQNDVAAPGLALAGSQEAYKVMVNSTKVSGGSEDRIVAGLLEAAKNAADKQIASDKAIATAQNEILKGIIGAINQNPKVSIPVAEII